MGDARVTRSSHIEGLGTSTDKKRDPSESVTLRLSQCVTCLKIRKFLLKL